MKASIIISDTTSQGLLLLAVNSLCTQTLAEEEYEILLPDLGNFQREEMAILSEIQKDRPNLKIIRHPGNRAEKINSAAAKAKGDILIFIESHCSAPPNWAAKLLAPFENSDILAVQGKVQPVPSKSIIRNGESILRHKAEENRKALKIDFAYFDFHNSAVRKSVWNKLQGLDSDIPIICEFDFGARMMESGITIHHQSDNALMHMNEINPSSYARIIARQGFEKALLLSKRGRTFFDKYFPSPTLTRHINILALAQLPIIFALMARLLAEFSILAIAERLNAKKLGISIFEIFAKDCHRYGAIKGLSKIKELK